MSGTVWMSGIKGNVLLGDKSGVREKYFGEAWTAAQFIRALLPTHMHEAMNRNARGFPVVRQDMPEAAAVWRPASFKGIKDVTAVAGYMVITGELIDLFKGMDFGDGGLVPFPFYEADLQTPLEQQYYMLNIGARKDTFLPEESGDVRKFMLDLDTGQQLWNVNETKSDGVICLSNSALEGPDLWVEETVRKKIFMSDRLGTALSNTQHAAEWRLMPCQIVGAAS
jgi:hypothetical protein